MLTQLLLFLFLFAPRKRPGDTVSRFGLAWETAMCAKIQRGATSNENRQKSRRGFRGFRYPILASFERNRSFPSDKEEQQLR